ncbi:glycosyltransferase [Mucilaginibacter corticis]|uniref:Glycosyltransferase n=1 Tax=Mucilaginibacter corticis TaxID=2597670 RepID=A0A556M8Y9_9SPHI|nr:glycosyltransferase [Mucilaginibacter corticis]TSJ36321.1 glycosyltransferase [Mucilaginibacter corticis]
MKFEDIQLPAFQRKMPERDLSICVIIPVKNEALHLKSTLESLFTQLHENGNRIDHRSYEVLLLINNSNDGSLQIASDFKFNNPSFRLIICDLELPPPLANIGTVRRLLMNEASRRFNILNKQRGIIASIDGDTVADSQWLYYIEQEINAGNDAVGGLITIRGKAGSAYRAYLLDLQYRNLLTEVEQILFPQIHDPLPRHFHFFGANMAVTSEYYHKSGGIPAVDSLEDMAFHAALLRCDARIRRSPRVKVITSARFDGRVAVGFSEQLKKWSQEHSECVPQIVESSELYIYSCFMKSQLYAVWSGKEFDSKSAFMVDLAKSLAVSARWLETLLGSHEFFGAVWEAAWQASKIRQQYQTTYEPIERAIRKLRKFTRNPVTNAFQTNLTGIYQRENVSNA